MVGRTLSHYQVLEEISRRGMGIVYRALDVKLGRELALKVLPPELVADPERRRRFEQEARAAAALEHPHIAVIHEIGESEGVTFIAMELIRGDKLREVMARGKLTAARALDLSTEVAEGLAKAHERGVVHRDLKPANIMLTEDGHAKIIDFGLAKLTEPVSTGVSQIETLLQKETDPGIVMGTVSYMSPEQARGEKVDQRSDIFSFGIVLHEMLSGHPPFRGPSGVETLNAILKTPAPPLAGLGADVSPEAMADLQRLVDKCLAKDPEERYQSIKDTIVDLRAARRRLETSAILASTSQVKRRKTWLLAGVAALGVALLVAALLVLVPGRRPQEIPPSSKPSLAVLYFENNTGDTSLDWLRTALTDMLVTDLSQSPQIEVLGTDRLYQILKEMNRLDERIISFDVVEEVAERGRVNTVLLGSFVKAGDAIRISIKVQEARTGKILTSERVEGVGESSLFPMVDNLTRRIKDRFEIPAEATAELDRGLKDITTSSVEAYRYYAEGIELHERQKEQEAVPLFEKALALDPGFAMAMAKLSIVHFNEGRRKESQEYARRAMENADRLTTRERYYIEGNYYSDQEATFGRSIDAYKKAVELYPDHGSARNNLALAYVLFERYDEAIRHGEELTRPGMRFAASYGILANAHFCRGNAGKAEQILRDFVRDNPENATGHQQLGVHLARVGNLQEALEAFQKAELLEPEASWPEFGRWQVFTVGDDVERALASTEKLKASDEPFWRWVGAMRQGATRLYQGRSREALSDLELAAKAFPEPEYLGAWAQAYAAHILIEKGDPLSALEPAQRARKEGAGNGSGWAGLFYQALAEERLGRRAEAEKTAEQLGLEAAALPTEKEKRRDHHLRGEIALSHGEVSRALEELELAESTLSPRGQGNPSGPPQHVPIWFSLGRAHLAAKEEGRAAEYFRRIVESTGERLQWPIPYVRSFYLLGKICENQGDLSKAREHDRRFVEYWKDGDLDRDQVAEAEKKLAQYEQP